ncbi:MAG: primosomal protein N' [Candidatus Pelagibacter sp. TMED272]|nr:primosomal protein N' [Pelagibacteraceae bacterium]RPG93661.1 MAG: primosomal protein N' [Candidatus Pelagibacter sp. TMED272]|tara:strand:- start:13950 stop:15893 length:1944 start_codon:yes stop_codon:yes gene_type:complete
MKAQVLLPKVFNFPFTYNSKNENKIGNLVEVPFGSKKAIGVIWKNKYLEPKNIKIKNIDKQTGYSIDRKLVDYIEWFSIYNMVPIGLVLKMVIGGTDKFFKSKDNSIKIKKTKKKLFNLNNEQQSALKFFEKIDNKFDVSVLQGTTGSGKTLVYFERIKKIIEKKNQALVLLPEIFLTNDFKSRFEDFFGFEPAIWHSKITPKQKRIIWKGIIKNEIKILVGARSALLLPFKKLGVIIVDEEHDSSYKQDEGVIYNARDMAISRASFEKIPIHLVTSVPSIETYNNIRNKKYRHIKIYKRFDNYPLPRTKLINLNINKTKKRFIANETVSLVKKYLNKGDQVLFFINRRGFAPYLICKKCGNKQTCSNCSLYLTFHKLKNKAICHHCSFEKEMKTKCKSMGLCEFTMYGPGVEKIFDETKDLFPEKRINIFSSDYLKKKHEMKNLFKDIKENKIDILIGTQMISKGFNFPKLNCIVVIDADFSGRGYDLRTTEKNIQLYHQLSGRAGRFSSESLIIYQTLTPHDSTLKELIKNKSEELLKNELLLREKNKLPPFIRLIAIIISSKDRNLSLQGAREIKMKLNPIKDLEILGPVDSPLLKIKKNFRSRLLIKFNNHNFMQKKITNVLNGLKISSKIKLTVDVDPINFA